MNPHSADQKHQSLSPGPLTARPKHATIVEVLAFKRAGWLFSTFQLVCSSPCLETDEMCFFLFLLKLFQIDDGVFTWDSDSDSVLHDINIEIPSGM